MSDQDIDTLIGAQRIIRGLQQELTEARGISKRWSLVKDAPSYDELQKHHQEAVRLLAQGADERDALRKQVEELKDSGIQHWPTKKPDYIPPEPGGEEG